MYAVSGATPLQSYWNAAKNGVIQAIEVNRDFWDGSWILEYSLFDESSFYKQCNVILDRKPSGVILAPLIEKESLWFMRSLEERNIPYVYDGQNILNKKNLVISVLILKGSGYIAGKNY